MPLPYNETLIVPPASQVHVQRLTSAVPTTMVINGPEPLVELTAADKARVITMLTESEE